MSILTLSDIYVYPIKSLSGIRLNSALVEERGLQYDRRWMLTDSNGSFLTQRTFPEMAFLNVVLGKDGLEITHKRQPFPPLLVPYEVPGTPAVDVTVWDDTCKALPVSRKADEWLSQALGRLCRLVYMPNNSIRRVDERYVPEPLNTSFSDGYPLLIIGQASLDQLNSRMGEALPMHRFRPNLVFTGGEPHAEDLWREFRVGDVNFRGVKLCARCVFTTIDQETGEKGPEPLRTLATYRKQGHKILFGQNLVALSGGEIRVGDRIEVLSMVS